MLNAARRVFAAPVLQALLAGILATSCLNDANLTRAPGPTPGDARFALSTVVADPAGKVVEISVFYTRLSGERIALPSNPMEVVFNNVQVDVPVTVDLTACLSDSQRLGSASGTACQLNVKLRLLDASRVPLDSNTTVAESTPGEVVRLSPAPLGGPAALPRFSLQVHAAVGNAGPGRVTGNGLDCSITGDTAAGTCNLELPQGTEINLSAQGTNSNAVKAWSAPCGTGPTCSFTLTANSSISVGFTAPPPTTAVLTIQATAGNVGPGRVTGNGIDCVIVGAVTSGTCHVQLAKGSTVTLAAQGTGGNAFVGWGGACSGTEPCSFTLNGDANVAAGFTAALRTLKVQAGSANAGPGQVTGNGIDCAISGGTATGTCSVQVASGTAVSLSGRGTSGNSLTAWTGACTGQTTCTFTMPDFDVAVGASFSAPAAVVATLSLSPSTAQTIRSGQSFILSALPKDASGNMITGRAITWSVTAGDPSVVQLSATSSTSTTAGAPVTVTGLNKAGVATITATVDGKTASIDVTVTVPQPARIVVSVTKDEIFVGQPTIATAKVFDAAGVEIPNASVTWSAAANLALSNPASLSVTATGSSLGQGLITARSTQVSSLTGAMLVTVVPGPRLILSLSGTGASGTVTSNPAGTPPISCSLNSGVQSSQGCSADFAYGTSVRFQAATTAAQNSYFAGWGSQTCDSNPTDTSCLITANLVSQPVNGTFLPCSMPITLGSASISPGESVTASGWLSDADCRDFGNPIDNYQYSLTNPGLHKVSMRALSGLDATGVELRLGAGTYFYQPGSQPEIYGLFPGSNRAAATLPRTSPNSAARGAYSLTVSALTDAAATGLQCVDILSASSGLSNIRLGGAGCPYATQSGVQTRGIRLYVYLSGFGSYDIQLNATGAGFAPLVELQKWAALSPSSTSFVAPTTTSGSGSVMTWSYSLPSTGSGWYTIWLTSQAPTSGLGPFTVAINGGIGF